MAMVQEQEQEQEQQKKKKAVKLLHVHGEPPRKNLLHASALSSASVSVSASAHPHSIAPPPPPPPPQPDASAGSLHVIYYLCRSSYGGHLEHPHLLRLPRPRHRHLLLRDVKQHLSTIRGAQFPSAFAWSYKRSYRNGYVWQDLSDDEDIIFPSGISYSYGGGSGGEYVLKGSEITGDSYIHCSDNPIKPLAIDQRQSSRIEAAPAIHHHHHHHQDMVTTGSSKDPELSDDCKLSSASSGLIMTRDLRVTTPTNYPNLRQVSVDVATQTAGPMEETTSFDYPPHSNGIDENPATEIDMKSELFLNPSPPSSSDSTISSNPTYSPSTDSHAISRSNFSCGARVSPSRPKVFIKAAEKEEVDDDAVSNLQEDNHLTRKKIESEPEAEIHTNSNYIEAEAIQLITNNDRNGMNPTWEETTNPSSTNSVHLHELLQAHDDADEVINSTMINSTINANDPSNHDRSNSITSSLRQHQSGAMSFIRFLNSCSGIGGLDVKEQSNRHNQKKLTSSNLPSGTNSTGNGGINAAAPANHANCTLKFANRQTGPSTDSCRMMIHDDFAVYNINVDHVNHSSSSNLMISTKIPANRTIKPNDDVATNRLQSERKKNDDDNRRDSSKKDHSTLETINRSAVISDMISTNYGCKSAGCSPLFVPREHYYTKAGLRLEMLSKPNYPTNRNARPSNPRFEILNHKANYRKPVSVGNPGIQELHPGTINGNQDSDR